MHKENKDDIFQNIVKPLRKAMLAHDITGDSVMKTFAEVMKDPDAPHAVRLRATELFVKWLGIGAPEKQKIEKELSIIIGGNDKTLKEM